MPSPPCHPWLALGLILYLISAVFLSIRGYRRNASPLPDSFHDWIGQWMRTYLASFEPMLMRFGVSPTLLSFSQLGMSLLTGVAYANGCVFLGGWLMLGCGVVDFLDGGLARRTARVTRRGAFLDSVIDRYAEFFTFCGLGVLFFPS
ncbi:MAG: CDP-alcohol phosphatidyltransferase family protein, partial [Deltaproteobacteria bacterium]|nr:CDP-alcohol phosphatidyltransferase family protein [Deltaproteobacteria bacterium]